MEMKTGKKLEWLLIGVFSLFVVFLWLRAYSMHSLHVQAVQKITDDTRAFVDDVVDKNYIGYAQPEKAKMAKKMFGDYWQRQQGEVEKKIKTEEDRLKSYYQNEHGHPYVVGIDSFYFMRLFENLLHKGHIGESVVNGQQHDDLVDKPIEQSFTKSIHMLMGVFIYRVLGAFGIHPDYEAGLYAVPVFFSVLLVIGSFLVTRLLCPNILAAFFAMVTINLSPLLLERVMTEWYDTDIYSVFFPLVIFGFFAYLFQSQTRGRKIIGLIGFVVSSMLYASVWQGWWYMFDLVLISGVLFFLDQYYSDTRDKELLQKNLGWLACAFIGGIVSVGLWTGWENAMNFLSGPPTAIGALTKVPQDAWPNVFLTVAELKKATPYMIARSAGGLWFFFISILGSIYLVLFGKIIRDKKIGVGFFVLFIWLGALYYASLNALRFAILLIVPMGILFGVVVERGISFALSAGKKLSRKLNYILIACLIIVSGTFLADYVSRAMTIANNRLPMINRAWYNSLFYIKNNSQPTAIVNSWWDYGHWFTQITKRKVLFDGKFQNSPVAYWMAQVLMTDDEKKAMGILRMLNLSGNQAFDVLIADGFDHLESVEILKSVALLSQEEAREFLEKKVHDYKKVSRILSLLYQDQMPEVYFIASYDMVGKMTAISHIGNWNFKRTDIWNYFKKSKPIEFTQYLNKRYGYTPQQCRDIIIQLNGLSEKEAMDWLTATKSISVNSLSNKFRKTEHAWLFDNGMVLEMPEYSLYVMGGYDADIGVPASLVRMNAGQLEEKQFTNSTIPDTVLLFQLKKDVPEDYHTLFVDKQLAKSLFVRMYFFGGEGLRYFKKVHEEKTPRGNYIYVFKVEWPK